MRRTTQLVPPAPEPDLGDYFFGLELNFGRSPERTHLSLHSTDPRSTLDLLRFWSGYKSEGPTYLQGHSADLFLAVPHPHSDNANTRLHVAVRFVELDDLETDLGVEHRQDFDRVMDIAQNMVADLVEAGVLSGSTGTVDIVAEPLSPQGDLRPESIEQMGFCIGATWLQHAGRNVFKNYRVWNPASREWEQ